MRRAIYLTIVLTAFAGLISVCAQGGDDGAEMPQSREAMIAWKQVADFTFVQREGDPRSPRFHTGLTGPNFDVFDHDAAFVDLARDANLSPASPPALEYLEDWAALAGSDVRVGFTTSTLGGEPSVLYVNVYNEAGSDQFSVFVIEVTERDFARWGGAARMLVLEGIVPSMAVFEEAQLAELEGAPLSKHTAFYEGVSAVVAGQTSGKAVQSAAAMALQTEQLRLIQNMMEMNNNAIMGYDYDGELGQW